MFGEEDIIDTYTRQDAIADGVIFNAGIIANRDVGLTTNPIEQLSKYELVKAIVESLEIVRHFRQPDMKEIIVNGKRV